MIKLTLLQNYIHFMTPNRYFIKTHINITIFNIFDQTIPLSYLKISPCVQCSTAHSLFCPTTIFLHEFCDLLHSLISFTPLTVH